MVFVSTCNSCPFLSFSTDKKYSDENDDAICFCSLTKDLTEVLIISWNDCLTKIHGSCPLRTGDFLKLEENDY